MDDIELRQLTASFAMPGTSTPNGLGIGHGLRLQDELRPGVSVLVRRREPHAIYRGSSGFTRVELPSGLTTADSSIVETVIAHSDLKLPSTWSERLALCNAKPELSHKVAAYLWQHGGPEIVELMQTALAEVLGRSRVPA